MSHHDKSNGQYYELKVMQETHFSELQQTLKEGFEGIRHELKLTREAGSFPLPVVERLIESNNQTYRNIIKTICLILCVLIAWLTGVKHFLPHLFQ